MLPNSTLSDFLTQLTGDNKEPLTLLKTKDNVDPAGPSPLSELLKEPLPFSEPNNSSLSPNLSWLTVLPLMETTDATEDGWITDSNT